MAPEANPDLSKELLEKYELLDKIGEGGMGRVYKVRHRLLQRFDVCKVIHSRIFLNDEQKRKFIREARVSSNLKKHKNIVAVFGAGGEEDYPYILFEYVKGVTLEVRIKEQKRLPLKEALFLAKEICEGLAYAHSEGIVHRDIKSENVILSDQIVDGYPIPKIADFGIATIKGEAPKAQKSEWALHGTPSYMSPEQAAGEEATEQSDIYSLGIILYEMLTGAVPFKGQSLHQVIMQHISEPPKPVHEVNPDVPIQAAELVHRALEKKPADRYPSAEDFAAKLEKALSFADRWLKGITSGVGPISSLKRSATHSFSSFPRGRQPPATTGVPAQGGRMVPTQTGLRRPDGGAGVSATQLPPPGTFADRLNELLLRYRLQVLVGGAILIVLLSFMAFRAFLGHPGTTNTLAYTPRDHKVVQGLRDVVVSWRSDAPYPSAIEYGTDENKMVTERGAAVQETDHSVKLSQLSPGKKYFFRVLYPGGQKSLTQNFALVEPDFRFSMSPLDDRGVRVEGETTVPAKATLYYEKGGKEMTATPQEGDGYENSHTFKVEGMNPETDKIRRVHLLFCTSETLDLPGEKVKLR